MVVTSDPGPKPIEPRWLWQLMFFGSYLTEESCE